MKRLNRILCLVAVLLFACLCLSVTTIALAEEPIKIEIGQVYRYEDEQGTYDVTIVSESEYTLQATSVDGTSFVISGNYVFDNNTLSLLFRGEPYGAFLVNGNNLVMVEEVQEPIEEELTEDTIAEKVAELVVKVNGLADSDFFAQKVLPFIISVGGALLTGLVILIPYIKKRTQFKVIQTAYSKLADETENLKKLLSSTDVGEIKDVIKSLFESELKELTNALKKDGSFYNETIALQKIIMTKLDNLTNGALNAWQSSKEAVKCLTNTAEMSTLASYEKVNSALKDYIKEIKGEEAEEIIKQLEA